MNCLYIMNGNLRLENNPALEYAASNGIKVLPVIIMDARIDLSGDASRWWTEEILKSISRRTGVSDILFFMDFGEYMHRINSMIREKKIDEILIHNIPRKRYSFLVNEMIEAFGSRVAVKKFDSNNLLKLEEMVNIEVNFNNFNSFFQKMKNRDMGKINDASDIPEFINPEINQLRKNSPWKEKLKKIWNVSINRDDILNKSLKDGRKNNSRISPFISHGQIDVKYIWKESQGNEFEEEIKRNLAWREFFYLSYLKKENMDRIEVNEKFRNFPWSTRSEDFLTWKSGNTGFPLIDGAMRQLWAEGWINNRLRMLVSDFLVKCLLIRWDFGANWFMDTLVDADESVNFSSWQYISGTGGFSWPFFRIFNPVKNENDLDPEGNYIRKWVPELNDDVWKETEKIQNMRKNNLSKYSDMRKRTLKIYEDFINNNLQA